MIEEVVNKSESTLKLKDEEFLLVIDLFLLQPKLKLQVNGNECGPDIKLLLLQCNPDPVVKEIARSPVIQG